MTAEIQTGFIYALVGPNGIRYIGRAKDPLPRYDQHKRDAADARHGRERGFRICWNYVNVRDWWASLEQDPEMIILEEVPLDDVERRELELITEYRQEGQRLTNRNALLVTILGRDVQPPNPSPDTDLLILREIRSGAPFRDKRPRLEGFEN